MFKQRVVFVHGAGSFGSAAWPRQHGMALSYDALFLRRHGYHPVAEPVESSFHEDAAIVLRSLADDGRGAAGGHVVAHSQGAIAANESLELDKRIP
jgi:pimeloyl-ACP methyl ester carboxylesterase